MLDQTDRVVADSLSKMNGQRLPLEEVSLVLSGEEDVCYRYHHMEDEDGAFWAVYYTHPILSEGEIVGALLFSDSIQDLLDSINSLTLRIILISIAGAILIIILSVVTSSLITKPIMSLKAAALDISRGEFGKRVEDKRPG